MLSREYIPRSLSILADLCLLLFVLRCAFAGMEYAMVLQYCLSFSSLNRSLFRAVSMYVRVFYISCMIRWPEFIIECE